MSIKNLVIFILTLWVFFIPGRLPASECGMEEVSGGMPGEVLCVKGVDGTDMLYAGTEEGLYRTRDAGSSWEKVQLPGGVFDVRDIAFAGEDIFIASESGVYTGRSGSGWERVSGIGDIMGVAASCEKAPDRVVLAWTGKELFRLNGRSPDRVSPELAWDRIDDVACRDGVILVASGGNIYRSSDGGKAWEKIFLVKDYDGEEEIERTTGDEDAGPRLSMIRNIDPSSEQGAVVATDRGIFLIGEGKRLPVRLDAAGLPVRRLEHAAYAGKRLFAATDKEVFLYSEKESRWKPFFAKTFPGAISALSGHTGSGGRTWLWAAGGRYLYRRDIDTLPGSQGEHDDAQKPSGREAGEPSIRDVQRMAVEYAEVSPEKIKRWRTGAKWKAIMPRVSLGFSESSDDNVEIYKSSTTSYVVTGPREIDTDWDIDLTWDLSDLVWNDVQTSIDVRSKLMVQLRSGILEDVTRLYFERKRLLEEIAGMEEQTREEPDRQKLLEKKIRAEEITAYIDALTGGKFTQAIEPVGEVGRGE